MSTEPPELLELVSSPCLDFHCMNTNLPMVLWKYFSSIRKDIIIDTFVEHPMIQCLIRDIPLLCHCVCTLSA